MTEDIWSRAAHPNSSATIAALLKRRGWTVVGINPTDRLLLPLSPPRAALGEFFTHLKRYGFRIFLRDLIRHRDNLRSEAVGDLCKFVEPSTARRYLAFCRQIGILRECSEGVYELASSSVHSFGDTFEWFLAELIAREFCAHTAWGIRIRDAHCPGDLDVLGWMERHFLYAEVKSSPPRNIEMGNIVAFLDRIDAIRPDLAIFLEDTELRMSDKIIPLFHDAMWKRGAARGSRTQPDVPIHRLQRETYRFANSVYITNSVPSVITNLRACVRDFLVNQGLKLGM